MNSPEIVKPNNFIRNIIDSDLETNKHNGKVVTRFPPEPNGYLHIGHAKSICLNFGIAQDYKGTCHLRFDDTNPAKEELEYMESIAKDIKWLGFDWKQNLFHASDYFEQFYAFAQQLIREGKAYICSLTADEVRQYRGTLTEPGKPSPDRNRPAEESLALLEKMRKGEFPDGKYTLRAKIDMAAPNINLRDPAIYRIRNVEHLRTGDAWHIYPMYDYAHCISDSIEGITHSICTLEFEDHRPLYDWFLDELRQKSHPQQIEFAKLKLDYTVMSKRFLLQLVQDKLVSGWDDPRMPTISGMRRRGYTPIAIRNFCEHVGVTKKDSYIELTTLENFIRDDLNVICPRAMAVINPIKVIIENYPAGEEEFLEVPNHPTNTEMGTRKVAFAKELYIEKDDFMEIPSKGYFRLSPGKEVRLRYAYIVKCERIEKDPLTGEINTIYCSYDPATKGGTTPDGRKIKGTIHWVSSKHAYNATINVYDRLYNVPFPSTGTDDFKKILNANSLQVLKNCYVEKSLQSAQAEEIFQFERLGYFNVDPVLSKPLEPVFNRTVTLRDSWSEGKPKA